MATKTKTQKEKFLLWLADEIRVLQTLVAEAQKEASKDLKYFLYWSDKAFERTAKLAAAQWIFKMTKRKATTLDKTYAWLLSGVETEARHPSRSSNATSNLMSQCELAAKAWLLDAVRQYNK